MKKNFDRYDTSDYPEDNRFQTPRVNKKVPGLFKDELNGKIITEFVGLRSKMYSVRTGRVDKMKKAKGLKKLCTEKGDSIRGLQEMFGKRLYNQQRAMYFPHKTSQNVYNSTDKNCTES